MGIQPARANPPSEPWDPISTVRPSGLDVIKTQELEKFMKARGLYEFLEEALKRVEVLGRLDQIVHNWMKKVIENKWYNEQMVEEARAMILV